MAGALEWCTAPNPIFFEAWQRTRNAILLNVNRTYVKLQQKVLILALVFPNMHLMLIDIISKLAPAIATLGGLFITFISFKGNRHEVSLKRFKLESEIIADLSKTMTESLPSHKEFIDNTNKERLFEALFCRAIHPKTIDPLMEFYNKGKATRRDIILALPFHKIVDGKLTFSITRWQRASMAFSAIYTILSIILMTMIVIALLYFPIGWKHKIILSSQGGCILMIGYIMLWAHKGIFTANKLSKL